MRLVFRVRMMRVSPQLLNFFTRQILLSMRVHVDLCGRNSAARHARDFKSRTDIERVNGFLEQLRRHSRIHQRAQEHVAADA